jgi:membrane associated rhomboid family serine protease
MSWRNPPLITIALIVINCVIFFNFQLTDDRNLEAALSYYAESAMAQVEAEKYLSFLAESGRKDELRELRQHNLAEPNSRVAFWQTIEEDVAFNKALRAGDIITPYDSNYADWIAFRSDFEAKLAKVVTWNHGYRPAYGSVTTLFSYMFLHSGVGHLVGNMVFLWLVGCMLEMACKRRYYLAGYLLTGLAAGALFGFFYSDSVTPLVGASGAIAGMMGAYTVIYCRRKIRVFLFLGFYFDYLKIPAVLLLPFWVGQEFYQLFGGGTSNVAYVAHIGGLFSGALLGFAQLRFLGGVPEALAQDDPQQEIDKYIEQGLQAMAALDFAKARSSMEKVLALDVKNTQVITHIFNIDKVEPQSERFQQSANRLLQILGSSRETYPEMVTVAREYSGLVKQNELSAEINCMLIHAFCEQRLLPEARAIMVHLLKGHAAFARIPESLLCLAKAYRAQEQEERCLECLKILGARFPDSPEARTSLALDG